MLAQCVNWDRHKYTYKRPVFSVENFTKCLSRNACQKFKKIGDFINLKNKFKMSLSTYIAFF